jgi:restriction-modification enzyme MmeI-like protein
VNAAEFIKKWNRSELRERQGSQAHFHDLCRLVGHQTPAEADPEGKWFCFEMGVTKHGDEEVEGKSGWADVWKKSFFGWEYKGKHKDLDAAYKQLLQYRESLQNPPLLVVSDMSTIVVHTNFTDAPKKIYEIPLDDLDNPRNLEIIGAVFHDPEKLRPGVTSKTITADAASRVAQIALSLRDRGYEAQKVAHFLDRIVFTMFAEDVGLLPKDLFTGIAKMTKFDPKGFTTIISNLFGSMATGGYFGDKPIIHFNGNLFSDGDVLELTEAEIKSVLEAAELDWSAVDPSIFGTLFERGLDPNKRSQLGAHYTSREDIEVLVDPVVMAPLRREWDEKRQVVTNLLTTGKKHPKGNEKPPTKGRLKKAHMESESILHGFLVRLSKVKVLDPACGSGNFLYVVLQKLKDLEKEVIVFAMDNGLGSFLPTVGPWQLHGIEINPYAFDLAQMTIWIGYLQWTKANGFGITQSPVLRLLDTFKCMDAILDISDPENPKEPEWPAVDFIVGNPPFLGGKKMRSELGNDYVDKVRTLFADRLPAFNDLCCFWFEKARQLISQRRCTRAGLLATQGIRGGPNREVLKRILESGTIFFAESDRPWILDGANVHVSMVGFDDGSETARTLDGKNVGKINSNLTSCADVTTARFLRSNEGLSFIGVQKSGPFDIDQELALNFLVEPNTNGKPSSDIFHLYWNATDITRRSRDVWVIDYSTMDEFEASKYDIPFNYLKDQVVPKRKAAHFNKFPFWQFWRPRPELHEAIKNQDSYIVTPRVSKHRIFRIIPKVIMCDSATCAFAESDYSFFGVLHSKIHETWARSQGTQLRERESGFRYTPQACFETFPLPKPNEVQKEAISAAAMELDDLRNGWLNPPEWTKEEVLEFPGSVDGPWARYVHDPDDWGIGTVRYPRTVPKDETCATRLKKRTLTNLYNERPTWLDLAHKKLDEAVFAAYGWDPGISDEEILEKLLALNLERAKRRVGGSK